MIAAKGSRQNFCRLCQQSGNFRYSFTLLVSPFGGLFLRMKVLIGLIEHFGDIVACEPVSRYIRAEYPNAQISWAVQTLFRELIDSNPNVDETIPLECLTEWIKLSKHGKYDQIVDLHVNLRVCQ